MKRFDWKQLCIYAAAVLSAKAGVAGAYPFIPAVFMVGFMSGVNRSLLFFCSLAGLLVFVPVVFLIKYSLALILAMILVKGLEWYKKNCSCIQSALIAGGSTLCMTVFGYGLHLRTGGSIPISILEGVFITGFVHALGRYGYLFMEWEPLHKVPPQILVGGGQRLEGYAESFEKLSKTFNQMNRYKEDFTAEELGRMQSEVTGRVCVSCGQCAVCWDSENPPMYQVLYRFLQKLQRGQDIEENTQELEQYCPYYGELIEQILQIFEKARLNMAWYNRLQENREVIAQQLNAMAYIMEDCAKENKDISLKEGKLLATVKYALKEAGVQVEYLKLLEKANGKKEFLLQGRSRNSKCIPAREIAKLITHLAGARYVSGRENRALLGQETVLFTFLEDTRFSVYHGIARMMKEGEQLSGDNFSFLPLDNGNFVMSLSDGMGCGVQACKESEMVIDLLEKFLEAGFHPETAIRMMNSAMVTHGENNLFSTVDIMNADLDSGQCEFYKIGAASTFIRKKDTVECLASVNPPVGVFSKMEIQNIRRQLHSGDFVVMVSDGVLDHLHVPDANVAMAEIITSLDTNNPGQMAKQILEHILLYTGGQVRDDMTVMVAGIWEKET
ncbi:Stage II sporulation protein E [uncultured Roseburia sp.]|uniref:SpoIIE family protein phosphatase n=1 Tax=Brotonthovivens ammoniilytica TaxID=2981725 RepID=A0ABT2TL38_9FIRM|nr:SpoIIE family protein phosphatase [Brotonthovivens ammoniilytica]MCU6762918.1 SpoIIE family protein phosphatase [Brotonthovivens ammoniilytica]SCI93811.1 Stage II sporulation protein E [uncultured Roseburia sp.]